MISPATYFEIQHCPNITKYITILHFTNYYLEITNVIFLNPQPLTIPIGPLYWTCLKCRETHS